MCAGSGWPTPDGTGERSLAHWWLPLDGVSYVLNATSRGFGVMLNINALASESRLQSDGYCFNVELAQLEHMTLVLAQLFHV